MASLRPELPKAAAPAKFALLRVPKPMLSISTFAQCVGENPGLQSLWRTQRIMPTINEVSTRGSGGVEMSMAASQIRLSVLCLTAYAGVTLIPSLASAQALAQVDSAA